MEAIARIDGKETWRGTLKLDKKGVCIVSFALPAEIEEGEGTLTCVITDGGVVETASKTIPILLQTMVFTKYWSGVLKHFARMFECTLKVVS